MRLSILLILLACFLTKSVSGQRLPNEAGVIIRGGLYSTVLDGMTDAKLFSHFRNGYAIGGDLYLVDGRVLMMPGVHFISIPKHDRSISDGFKMVRPEDNLGAHIPVRIGWLILHTKPISLKLAGGAYALYFFDKMVRKDLTKTYNTQLTTGWNAHIGILIYQFSIDLDYNRSFGDLRKHNHFKMSNLHMTIGFKL